MGTIMGNLQFDGGAGLIASERRLDQHFDCRIRFRCTRDAPPKWVGTFSWRCRQRRICESRRAIDSFIDPQQQRSQSIHTGRRVRFEGGADADFFLNSSNISINFEGDDSLDSYTDSGLIRFTGSQGDDVFINTGSIVRNFVGSGFSSALRAQPTVQFLGGADADLFLNSSTLLESILFSGDAGNDQLVNRGSLASINFQADAGNDSLYNYGTIDQAVNFSGDSDLSQAGNDLLFNSGLCPA